MNILSKYLFTLPSPSDIHQSNEEKYKRHLVQNLADARLALAQARLNLEDAHLSHERRKVKEKVANQRVIRLTREQTGK